MFGTCDIEGCDEPANLDGYCGDDHWNAGIEYGFELAQAMSNGEELPEPPTKTELEERRKRAQKWDPDKMQERIKQFQNAEI